MSVQMVFCFQTESEKKARILSLLENNHPEFLKEARRLARHCVHANLGLNLYRVPHTVTSDYVRQQMYIEKVDKRDRDRKPSNNVMGQVFRVDFVMVGWKIRSCDGSHGSPCRLWTLPKYKETVERFQLGHFKTKEYDENLKSEMVER